MNIFEMPPHRPDGVEKKIYDALKKKYRVTGRESRTEKNEKKEVHDPHSEPNTDDELEDFERKQVLGTKLDLNNIKPH